MFLDENLKNQLKEYLKLIENDLLISLSLDSGEKSKDLKEFLEEVIGESDGKISLVEKNFQSLHHLELIGRIKKLE